jgi:hypothetical protein
MGNLDSVYLNKLIVLLVLGFGYCGFLLYKKLKRKP